MASLQSPIARIDRKSLASLLGLAGLLAAAAGLALTIAAAVWDVGSGSRQPSWILDAQIYNIDAPGAKEGADVVSTRLRIGGAPVPFGKLALLRFSADSQGTATVPLSWERPKASQERSAVLMHGMGDSARVDAQGVHVSGLAPGQDYALPATLWMYAVPARSPARAIFRSLDGTGMEDCRNYCMLALGEVRTVEGWKEPSASAGWGSWLPSVGAAAMITGGAIALLFLRTGAAWIICSAGRWALTGLGLGRWLSLRARLPTL